MNVRDRVLGCIVGGAIGDAMGGPYEGERGPVVLDGQIRWRLSDDTELTLATCEALADDVDAAPGAIAERFVAWYRAGRVHGVGASTLKALRDLSAGAHWAIAGRSGEWAAGNGAAMRIAPLAFVADPDDEAGSQRIRDVCRITHRNDEAWIGALAVVSAIRAMALGTWTPDLELASFIVPELPDSVVRDRLALIGEQPHASIAQIAASTGSSGFVAESVPLAIAAARQIANTSFQTTLESVIAVGGDTDTIASIAGQIAGAWLGYHRLPRPLVERLPWHASDLNLVESFATRLAESGAPPWSTS